MTEDHKSQNWSEVTANYQRFRGVTPQTPICLAPIQSLRFTHSGNIIACCFNRKHTLGTYPNNTVEEAWNGDAAVALRKAINNKDLSLGCSSCAKSIQDNNFAAAGAYQYDYLVDHKSSGGFPTMMDFEIDSTCNLECVQCSGEYSSAIRKNREGKSKYPSPYDDAFVDQLIPFMPHLNEVKFVGGEPFLIKVHYRIWEEVIARNPSVLINVLTNATILSSRVKDLLEKGNFKISVSIDSLVKETYEEIRVNANYQEVMENIKFFKQVSERNGHIMNFNLCAMRQNWREIPDYLNYCTENDIKVVLHTVQFPNHCSLWNLSADKLKEILEYYQQSQVSSTGKTGPSNAQVLEALKNQISSWYQNSLKDPMNTDSGLADLSRMLREKLKDESREVYSMVSKLLEEFSAADQQKIVRFLLKLPTHTLVSEVSISNQERMLERFKTIAKYEPTIES